jgi:glycosyltransferase involved in cell wall biosynthesis
MKIGIVASLFPPYAVGGAEISAYYLSMGLAKAGHDVLVITPNFGKRTSIEERGRLKIYRFAFPDILKDQLSSKIMSNPLIYLLFAKNIRSAVKRFKLDILHAQNSPIFIPTHLAGKSVKRIATLRDYTSYCDSGFCSLYGNYKKNCSFFTYIKCKYRWHPSLLRAFHYKYDYINLKWKQRVLKSMNGIISVSNAVRDIYKEIGIESTPIHTVTPILDVKKTKSQIRRELGLLGKVVFYAGKLSIGKGSNRFLEMAKSMKNVNFIVVGTGPLKEDFVSASKNYENINYMGKIPHERVLDLYKAADVVCSTSVWPEPLSRVPIEALNIGTPCIATDVGGTNEIIEDGISGFLIPPNNTQVLMDKVNTILTDKKLSRKLSINGKNKINRDFDMKKIINEHIKFYKKVIES